MKGLVLAGGSGTRLRPLTHSSAKQLVPVANKPILFYGLEQLRDAGITDIGIVVGDTADEIEAAVGDGARLGVEVSYVQQDAPLGLAHAVLTAAEFLDGDDFVMFLGDNLIEGGIGQLVADFTAGDAEAQLLLKKVANPERFGVATLAADGTITRLDEKPARPASDLALVGVYLFRASIVEAAQRISPSRRGELEITDAIQRLIDDGRTVRSSLVTGWWLDTGKKDDLLDANRIVLRSLTGRVDGEIDDASELVGHVVVEAGARIVRSRIVGPAIVGHGTVVQDATVGPDTSIAAGCTIERSTVVGSVLLDRTVVRDVERLEASLLGREVVVEGATTTDPATRLTLGDHSHVTIGRDDPCASS